jgi:hypothetical protein
MPIEAITLSSTGSVCHELKGFDSDAFLAAFVAGFDDLTFKSSAISAKPLVYALLVCALLFVIPQGLI